MGQVSLSILLDEQVYQELQRRATAEKREATEVASAAITAWLALDEQLRAEFAAWERASDEDWQNFERELSEHGAR